MPSITIHTSDKKQTKAMTKVLEDLRVFAAEALSCPNRHLTKQQISLRIVPSVAAVSVADVELVMRAHDYAYRVEHQDDICLQFKRFLEARAPDYSYFVWLQLSQLGHSA